MAEVAAKDSPSAGNEPVDTGPASPPADPAALVEQGRALLRKRRFDDAGRYFDQALQLNPCDVAAHEAMATLRFLTKDFESAASHFREAARCDPRKAEPLINLGAVLNKTKDHKGAIDAIQKSLLRSRKNAEAYYNLGIAYRGCGQASMAISAYKEAIRLKSDFAEAHQNLGNAYLDTKNTRQASASFNRALEINPKLKGAQRGLQKVNAANAERSTISFGSNDSTYASGILAPAIVLTEIQRNADREIVHDTTKRLERSLMAWISDLHHQMEPAVKGLVKTISRNELTSATTKTATQIGVGVRESDDLARLLAEARQLLADHEQDILERSQKK